MNIFNWIGDFESIIATLTAITVVLGAVFQLIALIKRLLNYLKRTKFIKGILLSDKPLSISFSVSKNTKADSMFFRYDMVTMGAVISMKKIIGFCNEINKDTSLFTESDQVNFDEIHIGGPSSNIRVNNLMKRFENKFFLDTPKKNESNYRKRKLGLYFLNFTETSQRFSFGDDKQHKFEIDEEFLDCAIFIRICEGRSQHIIFGAYGWGTSQAIEFFTIHTKTLYNFAKEKGRLNESYFFVVPIHRVDDDFRFDKLYDLTDTMFTKAIKGN